MEARREHLDEQIRRNASTAGSFADFASHRARVMDLLAEAARCAGAANSASQATARPALTILGAGNCNDVDLATLLGLFEHLYLVDCDLDAVSRGIASQGRQDEARVTLIAPVDLMLGNAHSAIEKAMSGRPWRGVVASLCIVSQLIDSSLVSPTDDAGGVSPEVIVRQHLKLMVDLLPEGGVGLFVTDFASSTTAPELLSTPQPQLPALAFRLLSTGNFFRGLHPGALHRLMTSDPDFCNRINCEIPTPPWNWNVGNRVYAVSAIRMRRKLATIDITSR
jgi:hypothetical protein